MTAISLNTLEPRFQQICERIRADQKRLKVPGVAIGVYHQGQEYVAGFGRTSVENPLRVTPDTLFQVGSISKTFTGTMLMMLVEKGLLDLDKPVRKYLPKFKMADPNVEKHLSTRQLLTHTGGWVGDYFNDLGNGDDALEKMVKKIRKLEQVTPLGQTWSYNNTGFNIAGRLIEVLTEMPYEKAAQEMIFNPLGLEMTFFYPSDLLFTHRFVVGHFKEGKKVRVARPWAIGRAGNPVGGVVSTVRDLLKYARFHMGDGKTADGQQIISPESLKMMQTPQVDAGGRGQMGITWFIRGADSLSIFGHGGATKGQEAAFHFIPEKDFAVALLSNSTDGGVLTDNILKWVLDVYFQAALPAHSPIELPETELAEYAGVYELPLLAGELKVASNCLVWQETPRGGFPKPDSPPPPPEPPVRFKFYEKDRVIGLDEPAKGSLADFLRDETGAIRFFRFGGRAMKRKS